MRGHSPSLVFWMVSFRIIEARKANINCLLPKSVQFHLANFSNALWSLLFNDLLYFCPQLHTKLMLPKIHHRNCRFKASNIFFNASLVSWRLTIHHRAARKESELLLFLSPNSRCSRTSRHAKHVITRLLIDENFSNSGK